MKSKAHGNIQDTMRARLAALMARAQYNPKTLSEAAELNRGYVGMVLKPNGRGIGPEVLQALAGVLGRALNRDPRLVILQIYGYSTDDMKGGADGSPLEIAIADTVEAVTNGTAAPAPEPAPAPKATPKPKAPKAAKSAKPAPKAAKEPKAVKPKADPKPKAPKVKPEPKPKAPKPAKAAPAPKPADDVAPAPAALAVHVPEGQHVFTWPAVIAGRAVQVVCMAESRTALCRVAGIGKSTVYKSVQESSDPVHVEAAMRKPGVKVIAYSDKGTPTAADFKPESAYV